MAAAGGMVGAGAGPAEVRSWLWVTDFGGVVNLVESPVLSCGTEKHDSCDSDEQSGAECRKQTSDGAPSILCLSVSVSNMLGPFCWQWS